MTRALWHCANAVVAIGLLMFSIPFLIAAGVRTSWQLVNQERLARSAILRWENSRP